MKRVVPYLVFIILTGGLVAFIYKDKIFPPADAPGGQAATQGGGGGGRRGGGGGDTRRADQPVPVVVGSVRTDNVPVYLEGVGTVQAFNTATVRAQVSGRLIDVPYTEGQEVKAGDVLARIDPSIYQAAYDQAVSQKAKDEAALANARLDEARYTNLVKSNSASQQQADTAIWTVHQDEAQVKLDQASIDNAKTNLNYATIKAPIDGRTGIRLVDKGNLVSATDATGIVVITQLRPITVVFTLSEDTVSSVLEAQSKGTVPLQAVLAGTVIGEGSLLVVDNQIDQTTGTVKLKGVFPNDQNKLWPGQFVNVKLKLKTLENATVVPSVALQQGASGSYVYRVTPEKTAKLTYVKVIQEGERQSVIGEGISPGDQIVTNGFASLQDGSKLRFGEPETGAPARGAAPGASLDDGTKRRQEEAAAEASPPTSDEPKRRRRNQTGEKTGPGSAPAPQAQAPNR